MQFLKGLLIWKIIKTNTHIVKRCLISSFLIFISLYFFSDWENYFEIKQDLDKLFYTKVTKYLVLIIAATYIGFNLRKISILKNRKDKNPITSNEEILLDADLKKLLEKPNIFTKSNKIKNKYS